MESIEQLSKQISPESFGISNGQNIDPVIYDAQSSKT